MEKIIIVLIDKIIINKAKLTETEKRWQSQEKVDR